MPSVWYSLFFVYSMTILYSLKYYYFAIRNDEEWWYYTIKWDKHLPTISLKESLTLFYRVYWLGQPIRGDDLRNTIAFTAENVLAPADRPMFGRGWSDSVPVLFA